ncbi:MAG TPA: SDR family NAD(P)-dependent oxidoreductase [Solirubrobacteraceae bacterium]|jgi:short-subunit dehydrogenase
MDLVGRTALVTGATGGLGQAIAERLAGRGARLIVTGRRADVLEPLAARLGALAIGVDLADRDAVVRLAEEAGPIDVLVANAALPGSGRVEGYDVDQIDRVLDVNLRAPMVLARLLGVPMAERGSGHLVFVSSLSGKSATEGQSLYAATKFGLRGFATSLRADLHGTGVGVSTIFPGFIRDAGMFHDSGATLPSFVGTRTPADVADAVVRAIERDRAEIDVAPLPLRAGAALAGLAPELSARMARRLGAGQIARAIGAGQADKR